MTPAAASASLSAISSPTIDLPLVTLRAQPPGNVEDDAPRLGPVAAQWTCPPLATFAS